MKRLVFDLLSSLRAMLVLTRPWNCLSAALAVLVGAHLSEGNIFKVPLIFAMLTTAAITAGGNLTNDYFDQEIDAINKPGRPLPSRRVDPRAAALLASVLFVAGIGSSLPLGTGMAALATAMVVLAYLYSWKLKRSFLAGNVLVAFLSAMTVAYGGLAVGHPGQALPSMLLIFVFILCREILKTAEDYAGDAAHRARSLAVLLGKPTAVRLFAAGALLVAGLVLWPWLIGQVSLLYLVLVLLGVVPVLLATAVGTCLRPEQRRISLALRATKLIFFVWLVAMLVG